MARRPNRQTRRDLTKDNILDAIANTPAVLPRLRPPLVSRPQLLDVADHRSFAPTERQAVSSRRWRHRLVLSPAKPVERVMTKSHHPFFIGSKSVLGFRYPKELALCIRRQTRKEVIHAMGRAGGKVRRPKRNEWSNISCRRK